MVNPRLQNMSGLGTEYRTMPMVHPGLFGVMDGKIESGIHSL